MEFSTLSDHRRARACPAIMPARTPVGGGEAVHRAAEDGVRARVGDPGRLRVPRVRRVRRRGVVPAVPHLPARAGVDARRGGTRVAAVTNALLQAGARPRPKPPRSPGAADRRPAGRDRRCSAVRPAGGLSYIGPNCKQSVKADAPYSVPGEVVSGSLSVDTTSLYVCASSYGAAVRDMGAQTCSRPGPSRSPPSSSTPPHPRATTPHRPAADDLHRTIPAGPKVCPPSRRHCPSVRCVGKFRPGTKRGWMKPSRRGSSVARS